MKYPSPASKRSIRRANRNFRDVETSTRKGRRAARRSAESCEISRIVYKPGEKHEINTKLGNKLSAWMHTAGGSLKYHKM